ncbi:unnamed protein product, partial [Ectocarpus sp. 13 AM-2016]
MLHGHACDVRVHVYIYGVPRRNSSRWRCWRRSCEGTVSPWRAACGHRQHDARPQPYATLLVIMSQVFSKLPPGRERAVKSRCSACYMPKVPPCTDGRLMPPGETRGVLRRRGDQKRCDDVSRPPHHFAARKQRDHVDVAGKPRCKASAAEVLLFHF